VVNVNQSQPLISVLVLGPGGEILEVHLPPALAKEASNLPYAPQQYFQMIPGTVLVPVAKLVLRHIRLSGVNEALKRMATAHKGDYPPRRPVDISATQDGRFIVRDGNSTTAVAIAAGWPSIPCLLSQ
jgi:hypothetical protein